MARTRRESVRGRSGRRNQRGAVAVEAALVTPLLMLFVFGIIEFSLLMKDHVALSSAVRTGGRIASTNAGAGPGGADAAGSCVDPCTPEGAPMLAQLAANAVQQAGTALPRDSIEELWFYESNEKGYPGPEGSEGFSCEVKCVRYAWDPAQDGFRYLSGSWESSLIAACANDDPDEVGVYMKVRHPFITGLFGDGVVIDDHSVFAFEPLTSFDCAPGTHA